MDSQSLLLNSRSSQITQRVSFGRIKNYSFQASINDDLVKLAANMNPDGAVVVKW